MCTPPHTLNGAKTLKSNKNCDKTTHLYQKEANFNH